MNQRQMNEHWLTQLFQAQEISLNPPCKNKITGQHDVEYCEPEICQEAARLTEEALNVLGKMGYPRFILGG